MQNLKQNLKSWKWKFETTEKRIPKETKALCNVKKFIAQDGEIIKPEFMKCRICDHIDNVKEKFLWITLLSFTSNYL